MIRNKVDLDRTCVLLPFLRRVITRPPRSLSAKSISRLPRPPTDSLADPFRRPLFSDRMALTGRPRWGLMGQPGHSPAPNPFIVRRRF